MTEPRVIYRRIGQRQPGHAGRPPVMGTLNTRRLRNASPLMAGHAHSRRASVGVGRVGLLLPVVLAVVIVVALAIAIATALQPAGALSCGPAGPCPPVGEVGAPPPMPPMPPFGGCPPDVVVMCPRVAIPVVMR
jgi:hypothetical protein